MGKALFLAVKDLRVLLSDKGNIFWVFGFPVLFALFFGAIYSSAGDGPSGMKIAIVDEDKSEFSGSYVSRLESDEALSIVHLSRDEAMEQVRKGKPDPEGFLLTLKKLNQNRQKHILPNHCVVIEDSHWGLNAAKAAGMHTIAITNTYDAEQLSIAERIVTRLNELSISDLRQLCA